MTDYTNLRKIVTGDIIIKCRLGNEIRRIPINQAPTYDELCLIMYRVFKSQITDPENIVLKYMDNEGDMISLLDDNDITHAISISSLLKITVYNKTSSSVTASQSIEEIQTTLTQLRDQIDDLIKSFKPDTKQEKQIVDINKQETSKPTRKLTSAELAQFLSDDNTTKKVEKSSPVKELSTLSPSNHIPYYPPPSSSSSSQPQSQPQIKQSVQQQPTQQQPVQPAQQQPVQPVQQQPAQQPTQQQQQQNQQHGQPSQQQHYIQTPPSTGIPSTPISQQHQHQRPVSLQYPSPYPPSIQHQPQYGSPNYPPPPPPPPSKDTTNDPRLQQQQQQPPRQAYYVPPPPSSMNQTPQLPPQPYNPTARW